MAEYEAEIDRLIASHDDMSASFDRTITTLAGGSLALSISFVTDIAKHPTSVWAIKVSWIAMAVSLAVILVSFAVSVEVHRRVIEAGASYASQPRWVRRGVTAMNWTAGLAFLLGAGFLVFFACVNVH